MDKQLPSNEEWEDLYTVAVEFKKLKPWKWMWDSDLFGIQNPETGEIGYCCLLGGAGEFFGLSLYLGNEGLKGYLKIQSGEIMLEDQDSLYIQKCLMASFEDRDAIEDVDYEILKKLNLRFRGQNAWPLFRSYLPNYVSWFLNREEVRFLTLALEQVIQISKRFKKDPNILKPPVRNQIMVRVYDGQNWQDEWLEPSEEKEVMTGFVEADMLDDLTKLPYHGVWEADYSLIHEPVQDEPDERPYFPFIITFADHDQGIIMESTVVEPKEWVSTFLKSFHDITESIGSLPEEILLKREEIFNIMENISSDLEIELTMVDDLDVIDDVMGYMENSLDDPVTQIMERLMEDETFQNMLEDGTLEKSLQKGEIPDVIKDEVMQALIEKLESLDTNDYMTPEEDLSLDGVPIMFMDGKSPNEKNRTFSWQTTLFPEDDYHGNSTSEKSNKLEELDSEKNPELIYQFKITLNGIRPPIWRRIQVPGTFSFGDLHMTIQRAMGWEDYHMHEFSIDYPAFGERITIEDNEEEELISDWFNMGNRVANYIYDHGDSWEHRVELENILKSKKDTEYPRCINGKRACPPEDCGGTWGYEEILEILKNPDHEEYDETREWVGEDFDSEHFDLEKVVFIEFNA